MNEENVMNILHSNREKLEKYKKVIRLAIAIVTTMICVCGIYYLYMNRHVKFQDKNMAYEISRTIGPNVNPENVKYKDVYAIKELNIGFPGKYDTLEDIKLCKNLRILTINGGGDKWNSLETNDDVLIVTNKKAETFQKELADLIPELKRLKRFAYSNYCRNCDISDFSFLSECRQLEILRICYSDTTDFSFLKSCKKIVDIDLQESQIKDADDLKSLKNLETICIYDTPLSKDETEVESLCKAFPNAKIFISEDKVQNIDIKEE